MFAILFAAHCLPQMQKEPENPDFFSQKQNDAAANSSSPGEQSSGEQETIKFPWVMPAASIPRLTTCSPLAGDTSRRNPPLPTHHHQKEPL